MTFDPRISEWDNPMCIRDRDRSYTQEKLPVQIGNNTVGGTLFQYGCANDLQACSI